ncbi:MAG: helix-turn-helix domain-containing protein [Terriglobales bacterium]
MSVTVTSAAERALYLAAIERLATSHVLHGSESLCKLLRYLAEHSLQNPGVPVKEYQIATEVFGRPADFDPHLDSAIRVQAGRLRVKLAEYYSSEGVTDPILVELTKGSYAVSFHPRPVPPKPPTIGTPEERQIRNRARHIFLTWSMGVLALSILLAAGVAALVGRWENRARSASSAIGPAPPAVYQTFWRTFISAPAEPWVVFSNAAFVGRPESGMRYRNPALDSGSLILDHYTGVGEVLAVHELDRVFHTLNREIRVKRGSLFSLDDAKNNNLIFVGSPAENLSLRDIPMNEQFVFQRLSSGPRKGDLVVANLRARPGEPAYFMGTPPNITMSEDYAVVALMQGMNPRESVLILAGTSTIGTQAAVEYVCHEDSLAQLLSRLKVASSGTLKPFEVVLRVRVARGVPVESEIVAVRSEAAN